MRSFLARRAWTYRLFPDARDRCGAGERFECSTVGEAGLVVADFCEHAGAKLHAEAGEAGDNSGVGMGSECGLDRRFELVQSCADGVELPHDAA